MLASQGLPLYPFHKGIVLLDTSQMNTGSKVDTNYAMREHWSIALIRLSNFSFHRRGGSRFIEHHKGTVFAITRIKINFQLFNHAIEMIALGKI